MMRTNRSLRNHGKRPWPWLILAAVLISPPLSAQGEPEKTRQEWNHSLEEALNRSSRSKRPILAFVEDSF